MKKYQTVITASECELEELPALLDQLLSRLKLCIQLEETPDYRALEIKPVE